MVGGGAHGGRARGAEREHGGVGGDKDIGKGLEVGQELREGGAGALGVMGGGDKDEARHIIPVDGDASTAWFVVEHGGRVTLDVGMAVVVVRGDAHMAGTGDGRGCCACHGRQQRDVV